MTTEEMYTPEYDRVWRYVLRHREATATEIALNCDVSLDYAKAQLARIGTPSDDVIEPEPNRSRTGAEPEPVEGVKFDTEKARYDLIPPEIEEAIAKVLTFGAAKYGDRNWELGMRWGRPYAALRRHMAAWWGGENNDPETGFSHLAHAACCIAFLVAFEARGTGTDDRPEKA
jgi:hypothetical protein